MLNLDSDRWLDLHGLTVGDVTLPRDLMANFIRFLDTNPTHSELEPVYQNFIGHMFDLIDHQQSTCAATTASLPHLLNIAKRLPTNLHCDLLANCGILHRDDAATASDCPDLLEWYRVALVRVKIESIELATATTLSREEQFELFLAIACFYDLLRVGHALYAENALDFTCKHCGERFDGHIREDGCSFRRETASNEKRRFHMTPVDSLPQTLRLKSLQDFYFVYQIAKTGGHEHILTWLTNRLGEFACPICGSRQRPADN